MAVARPAGLLAECTDVAKPLLRNYVSNHSDTADQPVSQVSQPASLPAQPSSGGRVGAELFVSYLGLLFLT